MRILYFITWPNSKKATKTTERKSNDPIKSFIIHDKVINLQIQVHMIFQMIVFSSFSVISEWFQQASMDSDSLTLGLGYVRNVIKVLNLKTRFVFSICTAGSWGKISCPQKCSWCLKETKHTQRIKIQAMKSQECS